MFAMEPIGYVRAARAVAEDDYWGGVESSIAATGGPGEIRYSAERVFTDHPRVLTGDGTMTRTPTQTFAQYLAGVPAERRATLKKVRALVKTHLPKGYRETVRQRMILYEVPLTVYPDTYNGEPLCYVALASQKNYISLYVMAAYGSSTQARRLQDGFRAAGKKLDMGKSCIR